MTQTTSIQAEQETTDLAMAIHPADILMALIVSFLVPMFLPVSGGNINYARMAAIETVNAYRIRNQGDLIAIAQIIAFGLAALGSLSLSMADDISLSMTLRLRGNANALNRAAEQNRRALSKSVVTDPAPRPGEAEIPTATEDVDLSDAEAATGIRSAAHPAHDGPARPHPEQQAPATGQATTGLTREQRHQAIWATAMIKEAAELSASIPDLPPAERRAAEIRASALSACASELMSGPHVAGPAPASSPR
jgi:hypothetical protein